VEEVARYLHLNRADVERLAKDHLIPFEWRGGRIVFRKIAIDSWASPRILGLQGSRLVDYHRKTSTGTREVLPPGPVLPQLIRPQFIDPALPAKTKPSVLREMSTLAQKTGQVWDAPGLLAGLEQREELSSTGLPGGLALLHTREQESFLFESLFIVLGRTVQQIPFGASDGRPTDLFFLIACPDDRLHLHILSRLCLLAEKTELLECLRASKDPLSMYEHLIAAEQAVLEKLAV